MGSLTSAFSSPAISSLLFIAFIQSFAVFVGATALGLGFYGFLRITRFPLDLTTKAVGVLVILGSATVFIFACLAAAKDPRIAVPIGALTGFASFGIAVYSIHQWSSLNWYRLIKEAPLSVIVQHSREILLFTRRHHKFLGWLVFITATAHAAVFLPEITAWPLARIATGVIAWALLGLLIGLGLWVDRSMKQPRTFKRIRLVHLVTAVVFVVAIVVHVARLV